MPPKVNSKAAAGRARKAEQADKKSADAAAKAEAAEAAKWEEGGKGKGGKASAESKAEKAAEAARKKAERDALLAEEEASLPKPEKKAPKAGAKKAAAAAPPKSSVDDMITQLSASNIDDALDAMDYVGEKTGDKAAMGSKAAKIDTHPERRFKAAFEAFKERETPNFKADNPGLRKTQLDDIMYKAFQKHPDNPFNQVHASYDADKDTKLNLLQQKRDEIGKRLGS